MASEEVYLAMSHALEQRYPGLSVEIVRIDHETAPDWDGTTPRYKGWRIDFRSLERSDFVRHGLIAHAELVPGGDFDLAPDEFGHQRFGHGVIDATRLYRLGVHVPDFIPEGHCSERRVHTKKMQRQVAKLLKRAFALPRRQEAQP